MTAPPSGPATTRRVFTGARIFDGARMHDAHALVVEGGRVAALLPADRAPAAGQAEVVTLPGGVLAPGFVDLQVNGGDGLMLGDAASVEGIARICAAHRRLGSTALLPTLITDAPETTARVITAGIEAARAAVPGFLGLHLEGPHLDPRRKGAHDPALIRPMAGADLSLLCRAAAELPALMVTLAPEAATPAQIAALVAAGAVVSLGHSDTGLGPAMAAFAAGAGCVTHLFNAMSPLGHREPGLVGAALDCETAHAGLIADGHHIAPEALRIAIAAKRGVDRLFLVTDAMAPAGTDLVEFTLGGRRILRRDGRLELEDGTLAGADISLPEAVRHLVQGVGVPLATALRMATVVPAACIGMADRLGTLVPGRTADLVHLDADLALTGVWMDGEGV